MGTWVLFTTNAHQKYWEDLDRATYLTDVVHMLKDRSDVDLYKLNTPFIPCVSFNLPPLVLGTVDKVDVLIVPLSDGVLLDSERQRLSDVSFRLPIESVFITGPNGYCFMTRDAPLCISRYKPLHSCKMDTVRQLLNWS